MWDKLLKKKKKNRMVILKILNHPDGKQTNK